MNSRCSPYRPSFSPPARLRMLSERGETARAHGMEINYKRRSSLFKQLTSLRETAPRRWKPRPPRGQSGPRGESRAVVREGYATRRYLTYLSVCIGAPSPVGITKDATRRRWLDHFFFEYKIPRTVGPNFAPSPARAEFAFAPRRRTFRPE